MGASGIPTSIRIRPMTLGGSGISGSGTSWRGPLPAIVASGSSGISLGDPIGLSLIWLGPWTLRPSLWVLGIRREWNGCASSWPSRWRCT